MGKNLNKFVCYECGYESAKWLGRCPGCLAWNTLVEEAVGENTSGGKDSTAVALTDIPDEGISRFSSGVGELDRVLGGGIVPGSVILLGGDPGIGKSTLLLQVADRVATPETPVLYLCGEESLKQVRLRSFRLGIHNPGIYLLDEQDISVLEGTIDKLKPHLVIVDSIQTVHSPQVSSIPGSVAQLRACTAQVTDLAKSRDVAVFLVGHVTKEGVLAGPRVLEHMVDAVIYFEGDKNLALRLLRGIKNRFGSTDEIGLMEMSTGGLLEVVDPSYVFLSSPAVATTGTAVAATFEGTRPLLIEIQALVTQAGPGYGRRMASGIDQNRLALIIAVLEKHRGYGMAGCDVYLKVTGGVFLKDPAADLAIAAAIASSYRERALPRNVVFIGELSLSGQIRAVPFLDQRLKEVEKMGYHQVIIPGNISRVATPVKVEMVGVNGVAELIDWCMEG